jgi:hypothetical protein
VVRAGSVMRWRTSNTRWHFSHWYSYVGTLRKVYGRV